MNIKRGSVQNCQTQIRWQLQTMQSVKKVCLVQDVISNVKRPINYNQNMIGLNVDHTKEYQMESMMCNGLMETSGLVVEVSLSQNL